MLAFTAAALMLTPRRLRARRATLRLMLTMPLMAATRYADTDSYSATLRYADAAMPATLLSLALRRLCHTLAATIFSPLLMPLLMSARRQEAILCCLRCCRLRRHVRALPRQLCCRATR